MSNLKDEYYITYEVNGFPGKHKAGPYPWHLVQSQRQDIEGYGEVNNVEVINSKDLFLFFPKPTVNV